MVHYLIYYNGLKDDPEDPDDPVGGYEKQIRCLQEKVDIYKQELENNDTATMAPTFVNETSMLFEKQNMEETACPDAS